MTVGCDNESIPEGEMGAAAAAAAGWGCVRVCECVFASEDYSLHISWYHRKNIHRAEWQYFHMAHAHV